MTRCTLYILLPISIVAALFFVWQGSIQNFKAPDTVQTLEGAPQTIEQGPLASQLAIKMLGTNGGGYFNANSVASLRKSHAAIESDSDAADLLSSAPGLTYTFGKMVRDTRQGWAIFATMSRAVPGRRVHLLLGRATRKSHDRQHGCRERLQRQLSPAEIWKARKCASAMPMTALFATVTTDASCGAVIGMHDSFTPLGGLVPLFNIQTDEVIFGGVGAGLYSMLIYVIVAVFIGGLMVGRTPEYVGKKIEQKEVKMAIIAILATSVCILGFTALSSVVPFAKGGYWNGSYGAATGNLNNGGPHGFSEILYAYTSGAGNNGSAFAGISANTPWYNLTLGIDMLIAQIPVHHSGAGNCRQPRRQRN